MKAQSPAPNRGLLFYLSGCRKISFFLLANPVENSHDVLVHVGIPDRYVRSRILERADLACIDKQHGNQLGRRILCINSDFDIFGGPFWDSNITKQLARLPVVIGEDCDPAGLQ
jgi:hypothetical protein